MTPCCRTLCKARAQSLLVDYTCEHHIIHEGSSGATANYGSSRRQIGVLRANGTEKRRLCCTLKVNPGSTRQKDCLSPVWCALDSKSSVQHRRSLQSYFGKLYNETKNLPADTLVKETDGRDNLEKARQELSLLEKYLAALSQEELSKNSSPSTSRRDSNRESDSIIRDSSNEMRSSKDFGIQGERNVSNRPRETSLPSLCNDSFDLYLISFLASVNIAVYLFELASPIKNVDYNIYSLPVMYGAKINHLILIGEWWRLVTPMFLHSGLLHVSLNCWALLSFGPQVCKGYGSFTFFLIYVLGGIASNLASFLHTPETTVGGSGPVFAIIGAWFSYQMLNKGLISKETSEDMLHKATVATTLSCVLSSFGPIDNWGDLGAAFTGITFGFLTSSMVQVNDASSKAVQEEGIALISRHVYPCKSLMVFSVFLLVLGSLFFVMEPPLGTVELEDLFLMSE